MKTCLLWCVVLLSLFSEVRAEVIQQLKSSVNSLVVATDPDVQSKLAIETQRLIQIYIREADQNDWASPSAERLRRLDEVGSVITPSVPKLIELGMPSENSSGVNEAFNLISYAKPSDQLKQQLLELANLEKTTLQGHQVTKRAYGLLVEHGLATPDVRQEIASRMADYKDSQKTPEASAIYSGAKEWRLVEALPIYIDLLQREYRSNAELNWRVRSVAESVRGLGPKASAILPLLQQQLARMKAENADFRDINVVEGAIRAVEGKDPIEPLLTVSGAGPVGRNPLPTRSTPITALQTTPVPPVATLSHNQPPSPSLAETKSFSWPWIIGAILFLAVAGGVLFKYLRR
jgi:hypothetical protein